MSDYILDHKVQRRNKQDSEDDLDENAPPLNYKCSVIRRGKNSRVPKTIELPKKVQVVDLYSEVLHAIIRTLNSKGKDSKETFLLIAHLQQAFNIDEKSHKRLIDAVQQRTTPLVAYVEVIEAKDLRGKDANGLSDPYCRLFVTSKQKFTTSVKFKTLTPIWRDHFTIPVKSYQDGILTIEVWDYDDPEESISDKMGKFNEIKSARGFKNFITEITFSASKPGDYMGSLKIPLKSIPSEGFEKWFKLDYKSIDFHSKTGEIFLSVIIGPEKDKVIAAREYRQILEVLVIHELKQIKSEDSPWQGELSQHTDYLLQHLRLQGALKPSAINLAKWFVYTHAHCEYALNAKLFPQILTAIIEDQKCEEMSDEDMKVFWTAGETFLENFSGFMLNNFGCIFKNLPGSTQAYHLLRSLELLKDMSLLVQNTVTSSGNKITKDFIVQKTEESISAGAENWFSSIHENATDSNDEAATLIKTGESLIADLPKRLGLLDMVGKEFLGIHYFELTYRTFDKKYGELVEAFLDKLGKRKLESLKAKRITSSQEDDSVAKSLFELYHMVKNFAESSGDMTDIGGLSIQGYYHRWFHSSVDNWLGKAWREGYQRMERAVQLDVLHPVGEYGDESKLTSSAVDTKLIFTQILMFWDQLAWSSPEDSHTFIMKILDDFSKCILHYAELMTRKVEQLKRNSGAKFELYDELCYAINNIEHISQEMTQISVRLRTEKILSQVEENRGPQAAAQCKRTLELVLKNVNDDISNNTSQIIEKIGTLMHPAMYNFLLEDIEAKTEVGYKLCKYLDKSLETLEDKALAECCNKIFAVIWDKTSRALKALTVENVEKRRPEAYFQKIQKILQNLRLMFYPEGMPVVGSACFQNADIQEVEALTKIHGASTSDLMLFYAKERLRQQGLMNIRKVEHGALTFRAAYCEENEILLIEILNCRDLKPYDSNGLDDPYVKLHIIPHELYPNIKRKTTVKKKTLFPLFDETFSIPLTRKEKSLGGIIRFSVKDYDLFQKNDFIGEAFQSLETVRLTCANTELQVLPQINVPLSKPDNELEPMLQSLESRCWDPLALKFARKERVKQAGANA